MAVATLLAVEDDPTHRYVLERICTRFDYELDMLASGEEALKAVSMRRYAAILMDLGLPGIDGIDCAKKIRDFEKSRGMSPVPIIALTASISEEARQKCMAAGMDDFLSKPFKPEELRRILLRWVYQPARPNLKILKASEESDEDQRLIDLLSNSAD